MYCDHFRLTNNICITFISVHHVSFMSGHKPHGCILHDHVEVELQLYMRSNNWPFHGNCYTNISQYIPSENFS